MSLLFFLLAALIPVGNARSISTSERNAIWNNFKYRNAFVRWTVESANPTGTIIQGDDKKYQDPVFSVEVARHSLLKVVLPLADNSVRILTAQIPQSDYPFEIILTVGDSLLVATSKCYTIMKEQISDIDFRIHTPDISLGSLPHFYKNIQVSSGNPLPQFCSVLKHQESTTNKERIENKLRISLSGENKNQGSNICKNEQLGCVPLENCTFPIQEADGCCPTRCGNECEFNGIFHHHGSVFWPETCIRCKCTDGSVHCKLNHEQMCPVLPCPKNQQRKEEGQCCPSCVNFDYCSVHPCHEDATCTSSKVGAKCRCKEGFFGNGTYCYDIDECSFSWSVQEQLGGCSGSTCVNTKGSFRCDCLPGHPRIDQRTCLNLIRI